MQNVNDSKDIFTQRGKASWEFDGSGNVNENPNDGVVWTKTGSGNTGDAAFTEVTNGDLVPVTNESAPLNSLLKSRTWIKENQ